MKCISDLGNKVNHETETYLKQWNIEAKNIFEAMKHVSNMQKEWATG